MCVSDYVETRRCNHCGSGKALGITNSECVFGALGIERAGCVRHIASCSLCGCTIFFFQHFLIKAGDRGSTAVKVLCYKSEGRWFDPSWCQWIFH